MSLIPLASIIFLFLFCGVPWVPPMFGFGSCICSHQLLGELWWIGSDLWIYQNIITNHFLMLKSVVHVTTRDQLDVCRFCCGQKPCRSPWSVQSLTTKDKEASFAVVLMYWWRQIHSWERETEMFYGNLSPRTHPRNSLDRKTLKWTLKNCDRC